MNYYVVSFYAGHRRGRGLPEGLRRVRGVARGLARSSRPSRPFSVSPLCRFLPFWCFYARSILIRFPPPVSPFSANDMVPYRGGRAEVRGPLQGARLRDQDRQGRGGDADGHDRGGDRPQRVPHHQDRGARDQHRLERRGPEGRDRRAHQGPIVECSRVEYILV